MSSRRERTTGPDPAAGRARRRGRAAVAVAALVTAGLLPVTAGTAAAGPGRTAYTLPAEASGRAAVRLVAGQHVEFTLPAPANALTVRYSIPDAPGGGGILAPLEVTVNGGHRRTMTLSSQYAWLYNQYP